MAVDGKEPFSRLLSLGAFLLLYVLATVLTIHLLVRSGVDAVVPDLVGTSRDEAGRRLAEKNLKMTVQGELSSDRSPAGEVLQQSIPPGERVREGRGVGVLVSKGPRSRPVPRLGGLDARAVSVILGSSDFRVERTVSTCSDSSAEGTVVAQNPRPGEPTTAGRVALLVSAGPCSGRFVMRDFRGASYGETARTIEEMGFLVGLSRQETEDAPEGTILSQDPPEGALLSTSDPVRFTVASAMAEGTGGSAAESRLVWISVRSPFGFFRREAKIRLERGEVPGSGAIDFLLSPGKNSDFVFWAPSGTEAVVTTEGEESLRKVY